MQFIITEIGGWIVDVVIVVVVDVDVDVIDVVVVNVFLMNKCTKK